MIFKYDDIQFLFFIKGVTIDISSGDMLRDSQRAVIAFDVMNHQSSRITQLTQENMDILVAVIRRDWKQFEEREVSQPDEEATDEKSDDVKGGA